MNKTILQKIKEFICKIHGHYPDIENEVFDGTYYKTTCKRCRKHLTEFYGEWE